jgi:hypothetical protein
MARIVRPEIIDPAQYRGLNWIFEYTNQDGALTAWNCGQAACATFLTHHRLMDPGRAVDNMAWLERRHPPDQLGGYFGTGRQCVERIMRAFDLDLIEVRGVRGIEQQLERNNPVIIMHGMTHGKWLGINLPGGHWMVAYGCDASRVYLTNGWPMTWEEIEAGWRGIAGIWIRMNGRGLAKRV